MTKKMTESQRRAEQKCQAANREMKAKAKELRAAMKLTKTVTVADFSDAELRAELAVRAELEARRAAAARSERAQMIFANLDALLLLVPEHECSGCADYRTTNAYTGACARCVLIEARDCGGFDSSPSALELRITFSR